MAQLSEDDVGKPVYDDEGREVGSVDEVTDDGFYLRFGEGVEVTWGGGDEQRYPIGSGSVAEVSAERVTLEGDFEG
ncbi:hypothetical protein AUR64_19495 [Haloprofundus marisrubri]|uniref:PRC-barrel domain-containing protein n=1 Tax=Haloprofundus marisrubri TaxID=1514971 RepID=A0A0W1R5P9_9EURY|nr:hypothetical protein [Haloprofundus marisrubri]KTG08415.1 hypothetical protein AUR64_19495 [Haloprofundus marisrubri]